MFYAYTRPRYQVSVCRTIGPLVIYTLANVAGRKIKLLFAKVNFLLYNMESFS